MRSLIEKFIITLLASYSLYLYNPSQNPIVYVLVSLALSLLLDLFKNTKYKSLIYLAFIVLIFYNKYFLFLAPLIFYNLSYKYKSLSIILTMFFLQTTGVFTSFISLLAIYLSSRRDEYKRMVRENKMVRDNLKEDTISLKAYNQQLIRERDKDVEIAILKERNRISKELHDSVGHLVSSSILQVEALTLVTGSSNEEISKGLDLLQERLRSGMKEIRQSIHNIHSRSLDLKKQIINTIEEYPNLNIKLNYNIREKLEYELKFDILSIVRETIINTSKHSSGDSMVINILEQPKFFSLNIKDNGKNLTNNIEKTGIGLMAIEELAYKYKGFVNYNLDKGFNIHITLMKGN